MRFTNGVRTARAINVIKRSESRKLFDGKLRTLDVIKLDKWLTALRRKLKRRSDNDLKGGTPKILLPIVNGCVDTNIVRELLQATIPSDSYRPALTSTGDAATSADAIGTRYRKARNILSM
jgi:hypothetical protein